MERPQQYRDVDKLGDMPLSGKSDDGKFPAKSPRPKRRAGLQAGAPPSLRSLQARLIKHELRTTPPPNPDAGPLCIFGQGDKRVEVTEEMVRRATRSGFGVVMGKLKKIGWRWRRAASG